MVDQWVFWVRKPTNSQQMYHLLTGWIKVLGSTKWTILRRMTLKYAMSSLKGADHKTCRSTNRRHRMFVTHRPLSLSPRLLEFCISSGLPWWFWKLCSGWTMEQISPLVLLCSNFCMYCFRKKIWPSWLFPHTHTHRYISVPSNLTRLDDYLYSQYDKLQLYKHDFY